MNSKAQQSFDVEAENPGFTFTNSFVEVWNSAGSGADTDASVWRPRIGTDIVFFGDFAHARRGAPDASTDVMISADHATMLAKPASYELEWAKKRGKKHFYGWRAIPPSPDFAALGHVVTTSKNAPELQQYRCVHKALLMPKSLNKMQQLWTDKGSWMGDDGSLWRAPPPSAPLPPAPYVTHLIELLHATAPPLTCACLPACLFAYRVAQVARSLSEARATSRPPGCSGRSIQHTFRPINF